MGAGQSMKRREFITALGVTATWPFGARAQKTARPTIGFLNGSSATAYAAYVQAFIRGLAETGYKVAENVAIEYRWADGHYERIPEMANDLVLRQVAVIAANTPAARTAKRVAGNIPVVFFTGEDPVASGLVTSLNRPGGNATGVTSMFGGLAAKHWLGRIFDQKSAHNIDLLLKAVEQNLPELSRDALRKRKEEVITPQQATDYVKDRPRHRHQRRARATEAGQGLAQDL
jgi:hypothetical protein